jgi:hypothetical protein
MKTVILVLSEHQSPADRGRMAHALTLASQLKEAGVEHRLVFAGKGVDWLPQFLNPERAEEHPFVQHYGHRFDEVREHVQTCSFCNRRFGTTDVVAAAGVPIHGDGAHMDHVWMVTEGWQVITF